jgi:hypothetical protein
MEEGLGKGKKESEDLSRKEGQLLGADRGSAREARGQNQSRMESGKLRNGLVTSCLARLADPLLDLVFRQIAHGIHAPPLLVTTPPMVSDAFPAVRGESDLILRIGLVEEAALDAVR